MPTRPSDHQPPSTPTPKTYHHCLYMKQIMIVPSIPTLFTLNYGTMNKIPGFLFSRENQQKSHVKLKYKKSM